MRALITNDYGAAAEFIARVKHPVAWSEDQLAQCALVRIITPDHITAAYIWMHFTDIDVLSIHVIVDHPYRGFSRTVFSERIIKSITALAWLMGAQTLRGDFANEGTARAYQRMWSRHTHCYQQGASVIHNLEQP